MPFFLDYNRTNVGYHGTSREKAERIVRTQRFSPSRNNHDWLGHGVYFWEHAPRQALWWAERRHGKEDAAVVASMIRLGNCLDMLDPHNAVELRAFHDRLDADFRSSGTPLVKNHNTKKYRDCAVFQAYYEHVRANLGENVDSARGVYVPSLGASHVEGGGARLWDRSWLTLDAHIQICTREHAMPACIMGTWPIVSAG